VRRVPLGRWFGHEVVLVVRPLSACQVRLILPDRIVEMDAADFLAVADAVRKGFLSSGRISDSDSIVGVPV
jgi:hypothetical protein